MRKSEWQQPPFNGNYTASIFVSQDPMAIDSVGADFLNNEPAVTGSNHSAADITNENPQTSASTNTGTTPPKTVLPQPRKAGRHRADSE